MKLSLLICLIALGSISFLRPQQDNKHLGSYSSVYDYEHNELVHVCDDCTSSFSYDGENILYINEKQEVEKFKVRQINDSVYVNANVRITVYKDSLMIYYKKDKWTTIFKNNENQHNKR